MTPAEIEGLTVFRLAEPIELATIPVRWANDYWQVFRERNHGASSVDYHASYAALATDVIKRSGTVALVFADRAASEHLFGWCVFESTARELAVHYCYTFAFERGFPRGAGIFRHALEKFVLPERKPGARLVHTHQTPKWAPIARAIGSSYHPLRFYQEAP